VTNGIEWVAGWKWMDDACVWSWRLERREEAGSAL
jgi:hypothetical protein